MLHIRRQHLLLRRMLDLRPEVEERLVGRASTTTAVPGMLEVRSAVQHQERVQA